MKNDSFPETSASNTIRSFPFQKNEWMLSSEPRRIMRDSFVARSKTPSAIFFSCGNRNAILLPSGDNRGWRTAGNPKNWSIVGDVAGSAAAVEEAEAAFDVVIVGINTVAKN